MSKSYLNDIVKVFSSNIAALICTGVVYVLLTRLLMPEGYGIYISLLVVPLIAGSLVQMGMLRASIVELGKKEIPADKLISSVFSIFILSSLSGMLLSFLGYILLDNPDFTPMMILLAILLIPVYLGTSYARGIYLGKQQIGTSNRLIWAPFTLNALLIVLFVLVMDWGVEGAVLAFFAAYAFVFFVALYDLCKHHRIRVHFEKALIFRLMRLGIVFAAANLTFLLIYKIDILILQKMLSAAEVGIYSLAASLIEQIWLIPQAMSVVIMSHASNEKDIHRSKEETHRMMRLGLLAGALGSAVLWVFVPWVVPVFFGQAFLESAYMMRLLSPAIIVFIIVRVLDSFLASQAKPKYALYVFMPMVFVNIMLNILLIPHFGIEGAAYATLVAYGLGSLIYVFVYMHITQSSLQSLFRYRKDDFKEIIGFLNRRKKG